MKSSSSHPTRLDGSYLAAPGALTQQALRYTPGGVHSSIRRFDPMLDFVEAFGSRVTDAAGTEYIDYHAAFGPILLGHRDSAVMDSVQQALGRIDLVGSGTSQYELELSRLITRHVPSAERVLLTNSGSEATYHAIRVSRAFTGRKRIVKFRGSYHGWHDAVAVSVGPVSERGHSDLLSAGVLESTTRETLTGIFNDFATVEQLFAKHGSEIAAVIVEPIQHGVGCIPPEGSFLMDLRRITRDHGSILIFDEVITGFRHALGGYQAIAGIEPDLTTLGKAMANGFPIGALGGNREIMDRFNTHPSGDVFFAGTFNGHPASIAAAIATVKRLEEPGTYEYLFTLGEQMRAGLQLISGTLPFPTCVAGYGSVYILYFQEQPPRRTVDLEGHDGDRFLQFRRGLLAGRVFETLMNLKRCHISLAHSPEDIDRTLNVAEDVLARLPR